MFSLICFSTVINHAMDTDQDNIDPFAHTVANIGSAAHGAMAAHIDRSEKTSNKRIHGPQMSNVEKIESLFVSIDNVEAIFSLVDNVPHCLLLQANGVNFLCDVSFGQSFNSLIIALENRYPAWNHHKLQSEGNTVSILVQVRL